MVWVRRQGQIEKKWQQVVDGKQEGGESCRAGETGLSHMFVEAVESKVRSENRRWRHECKKRKEVETVGAIGGELGIGVEVIGWLEGFKGGGDVGGGADRVVFSFVMSAKGTGMEADEFGIVTFSTWMKLMQLMGCGGQIIEDKWNVIKGVHGTGGARGGAREILDARRHPGTGHS